MIPNNVAVIILLISFSIVGITLIYAMVANYLLQRLDRKLDHVTEVADKMQDRINLMQKIKAEHDQHN